MNRRAVLAVFAVLMAGIVCAARGEVAVRVKADFKVAGKAGDGSGGHYDKVVWVPTEDDRVVIVTAGNKMVQAFDVVSGKERWRAVYDRSIVAMTSNMAHVYVALEAGAGDGVESIRRVDVATGKDATPKGMLQPFLPRAMLWMPMAGGLCVVTQAEVWIYSQDLTGVEARIPYEGSGYPEVTSDGKTILLWERGGRCRVIWPGAGGSATAALTGKWREVADDKIVTDAPFLSNAFYETGGGMVRVIDNSWSTGRIYFHASPVKEAREEPSENGHAIAAVDWSRKRVAVSGTSKNLLLFTTAGERQLEMRDAVRSRTYSMAFSPGGKWLAALGEDGSVRVFEME
ncbi:hypothetical protein [Luteolibacter soli]|uniref:WD40 repeat domain-containing protein n=1 Tax=Luteolibacter soli TaxID=3135280 RepID=A0ABU9AY79_9BACT